MKANKILGFTLVLLLQGIFNLCEGQTTASIQSTAWLKPPNASLNTVSNTTSLSQPIVLSNSRTKSQEMSSSVVVTPTQTKYISSTGFVSSSSVSSLPSSTSLPNQRPPFQPAELTSFGIFLVTFGGVLVGFMIIALIWICCRGRERSPEAPHTQVKMKPWSNRTPDHSVADLATEVTDANRVEAPTNGNRIDHPTSYRNQGLNSSNPSSPTSGNNNTTQGSTEDFSQTNPDINASHELPLTEDTAPGPRRTSLSDGDADVTDSLVTQHQSTPPRDVLQDGNSVLGREIEIVDI